MEHRQCHEPGKPEQAGGGVQGEYEPFVEEAAVGLVAAREDGVEGEVGEGEEGGGSDEDEVGGRGGGGGGMGVMEIPGCYVAVQAERDDGEDELEDAKRKVEVKHRDVSCIVILRSWLAVCGVGMWGRCSLDKGVCVC